MTFAMCFDAGMLVGLLLFLLLLLLIVGASVAFVVVALLKRTGARRGRPAADGLRIFRPAGDSLKR